MLNTIVELCRKCAGILSVLTLIVWSVLNVDEARAAISFAQQNAISFNYTFSNSADVAFPADTTAGNLIIVGIYFGPGTSLASITDSQGNTYSQIGTALSSPSGKQNTALFYAKDIHGGPDSVTVTLTGVPLFPGLAIYVFEYRDADRLSPLVSSAQASGFSPDVSSGAVVATGSGDLLFGFCVSDSWCSAGPGFIERSTYESNLGEEGIIDTGGGAYAVTATATDAWTMHAAAFRTASLVSDSDPPSIPTGLSARSVSISQIELSWTASADNVGVAGYVVKRNGSEAARVRGTTYLDSQLAAETSYTYTVAAFDEAGNVSASSDPAGAATLAGSDTVPPLISLTSPIANLGVSGTITVAVDVSDNIGIAGVQFLIDNAKLGAERISPPYNLSWDTTSVNNGTHTLSAIARDAAGNQTAATPVPVIVDNPVGVAAPFSVGSAPALKFGTHEVVLTGDGSVSNPFSTVATVAFIPPSGNAVTVRAFYDGANTWRARVYVTETGNWKWLSSSSSDRGLDGSSGGFDAFPSNLSGLLKQDPFNPKAWRSENGQSFAAVADTAWLLFNRDPVVTQNWQQFVQDDVARGINTLGPVGSLESWGDNASDHEGNNEPWDASSGDFTRYDLAKFQNAESRLIWIFTNYPNLYIQSMLLGTQLQWGWLGLPQAVRNDTLDYMIARWSAFPNLFWLISEDQEVDFNDTLEFNREVGNYYATHEPWIHLLSTQMSRDQGFPFTRRSDLNWVGYISVQLSDPLGATQIRDFTDVPRHVMMTESYYEQDYGEAPSNFADPRFYFSWSIWSWLMSGGSANYGGRYGVIHPYSQTSRNDLIWIGPGGANFTGYQLRGLDSVANIWAYFQNRAIDLGLFQPNDSLVESWAMRNGDVWTPKAMQRGTEEFLVYTPNASSEGMWASIDDQQAASMTIDLTTANKTFRVEWYRPYDGLTQNDGVVQGGAKRIFTAPWQGYEVVLRLTAVPQ